MVIPPPIYGDYPTNALEMNSMVIEHNFPAHLADLASEYDVTVIDAFKAMGGTYLFTYYQFPTQTIFN